MRVSSLFAAVLTLLTTAAPVPAEGLRLSDVTKASGIDFRHLAAWSAEKHLPETMGAGVVLLDFDLDGDLDAYFVQGAPAAGGDEPAPPNELWRNEGGLGFRRVPEAGGAADRGLGQGACAGDVDGDGDPDLYVANAGPDALYLNDGGSFRRASLGPGAPEEDLWSVSCTFGDFDADGSLDLYVVRYVDWHPVRKNPECGEVAKRIRSYCHPDVFRGAHDRLLLGDGRGGFVDATVPSGLEKADGKGLGVAAFDAEGDGDLDLVVANDSTPNFLWVNDGRGRFRERGLLKGLALNENGETEAGMGVATGDVDGDGLADVFMAHLDLETNTLWVQDSRGRFRDLTSERGLAVPSLGRVGFGSELADFDLDGDLDLFVTNGHIIDNIAEFNSSLDWAQPDQLLLNDGSGHFTELAPRDGGPSWPPAVGRGAAAGDLDGDGDLDLVLTRNGGKAQVIRNDLDPQPAALVLDLEATLGHREAQGARVELRAAGAAADSAPLAWREVQGARSYASQGTRLVHLPALDGGSAVTVRWPGRGVETWPKLGPGRHRLVEGEAPKPPRPKGADSGTGKP